MEETAQHSSAPEHQSLWNRAFASLFSVQFLGAFNDNFFKSAVSVMWVMLPNDLGLPTDQLLVLAGVIFILPFVLFSVWAGKLTVIVDKLVWIRTIKIAEALIMVVAAMVIGFDLPYATVLLLILLFLMGTQSALFGPVKYSILPQITVGHGLMRANAVFEGSTFIAILIGMLTGSALMEADLAVVLCAGLVVVAVMGIVAAMTLNFNDSSDLPATDFMTQQGQFKSQLALIFQHRPLLVAIVIMSWFWSVGTVLITELPYIANEVLQAPFIITLFLSFLVLGIVMGNYGVAAAAKCHSEAALLSAGIVAYMLMGILLLVFALQYSLLRGDPTLVLHSWANISLSHSPVLLMLGNVLLLAVCAGVFSVPVFTQLFRYVTETQLSLVIGQNNFWNAVMMVGISLVVLLLLNIVSLPTVLLSLGIVHLLLFPLLFLLHQESWQRVVLRAIFHAFYKVSVTGLQHYPISSTAREEGLLIASNHVSYLDAPLLLALLPRQPVFIIDRTVKQKWWVKIWLDACTVYPIDPSSPYALKTVIKILKQGDHVAIFPEGNISSTSRWGKIYSGLAVAADRTGCPILGTHIAGLELTRFGRLSGLPKRFCHPVRLHFAAPLRLQAPAEYSGKRRRQFVTEETEIYLNHVAFQGSDYHQHLYTRLVNSAVDYGLKRVVIEDIVGAPMTYKRFLLAASLLGQKLKPLAPLGGGIGIMLPNAQAVAATFFALQACDRVAVMLNFSSGIDNLQHAVRLSGITALVTSRRFVELGQLQPVIATLSGMVTVVYLEDIRESISLWQKISSLVSLSCLRRNPKMHRRPDQTAVILFTSGSEGVPKGVALSHANIVANVFQALSVTDIHAQDRIFNPLPVFHCFGLVAGMILPLFAGARSFQFPSPLRYQQIAELVYQWRPTLLFGADSFMRRYAEIAHPLDMASVRLVVAGAEKLKPETAALWHRKFGKTIYQGYGVTEASPVIAVNTPRFHLPGSVGMPLPGIECRLQAVEGLSDAERNANVGLLHIRGPNVMQGYVLPENPGKIVPPKQRWYNTGDIVDISVEGFITILGRHKRFAKIAGEMIGLDRVELMAQSLWSNSQQAALAISHPKRGEQIVLLTTSVEATREELISYIQQLGLSMLYCPGIILPISEMPLLATGKIDYVTLKTMLTASTEAQ